MYRRSNHLFGLALALSSASPSLAGDLASAQTAPRDTIDVFFLGNSYVYYNNLADQLSAMSEGLSGPVVRTEHHLHGGFSLRRHLDDGHLPRALGVGAETGNGWDIIVIQEHSQLGVPYADPEAGSLGDPGPFLQGAAQVTRMVEDLGARPVFYMTWAKEAFPSQTTTLARVYDEAGRQNRAVVAPVGLAWARVREERPDIVLFHPDGSHPSPAGTYLAACVFYAQLTGQPPIGAPTELRGLDMRTPGVVVSDEPVPLVRLREEAASYLQRTAWEVVRSRGS